MVLCKTISLWKSLQSQSSVLWGGFLERLESRKLQRRVGGGGGVKGGGEGKWVWEWGRGRERERE